MNVVVSSNGWQQYVERIEPIVRNRYLASLEYHDEEDDEVDYIDALEGMCTCSAEWCDGSCGLAALGECAVQWTIIIDSPDVPF